MRPVLILRPEPGATATARRARMLGLDPLVAPLFRIEPLDWSAPDPADFDALLLTSANAVRFGGSGLKRLVGLPVHAVGRATADAAEEAGLHVATVGECGVEDLLEPIDPDVRLLHLCGVHRTRTPMTRAVQMLPVYRSTAIPPEDWRPRQVEDVVAMVHSPRAAGTFAAAIETRGCDRSRIAIAAISSAALEAVGNGWQRLEAADHPTDERLLALAARLCETDAQ